LGGKVGGVRKSEEKKKRKARAKKANALKEITVIN